MFMEHLQYTLLPYTFIIDVHTTPVIHLPPLYIHHICSHNTCNTPFPLVHSSYIFMEHVQYTLLPDTFITYAHTTPVIHLPPYTFIIYIHGTPAIHLPPLYIYHTCSHNTCNTPSTLIQLSYVYTQHL